MPSLNSDRDLPPEGFKCGKVNYHSKIKHKTYFNSRLKIFCQISVA
jgi:hypothetical protein